MATLTVFALAAVPAGAQLDVAETRLEVRANQFLAEGNQWDGAPVTAYLDVAVCYAPGGLNPQSGAMNITVAQTSEAPAWTEVSLRHESLSVALPFGPTLEEECTEPAEFEVRMKAVDEMAWSTSISLDFKIEASLEGETGTYRLPEGQSARLSVTTMEDPAEDIIRKLEEEGLANQTEKVEEQTPAPALLPVALFLALAVHRLRRRDR